MAVGRLLQVILAIFSSHTLDHLLAQYGYAAVFAFVMVESLGIPFPGETMVIAAALSAGTSHTLSVQLIWVAAAAGAIIGDNGFAIGHRLLRRYGPGSASTSAFWPSTPPAGSSGRVPYALGFYYGGSALKGVGEQADVGLGVAAVVVVVGFAWWTCRHRRRLERGPSAPIPEP